MPGVCERQEVRIMVQVIKKDGKVQCVTTIPYSTETLRIMKKAGYKITEKSDKEKVSRDDG